MDMAWWRDLVIVILGLITTIALAVISVIAILLYRRSVVLMNSANEVMEKVNVIVDYTEKEVVRPIMQFGAVVQGVAQVVTAVSDLFRKKEDNYE